MNIQWLSFLTICATLVACATDGATDGATPDDAAENTQDVGADSAGPTQDVDTDSAAPGNNAEADVAVEEDVPAPIEVAATLRVVDPATGNGSANVTVTAGDSEATTDGQGRGTVTIAPGPYEIALTRSDTRTHRVFGVAADQPFEQITYMSPEQITALVYNALGLTDDPDRGILVVGLDLPNLAPAVGAAAAIDKESDDPFVLTGFTAVFDNEIPDNGQGFVTFPNVAPGSVNITVTYPEGECRIFPAETDAVPVEVTAGEVSVVAYTCRPM